MTFTIDVPDDVARPLTLMSQGDRDLLIADLLAATWEQEADAIERGIADDEAGHLMSHEEFVVKWNEYRAQVREREVADESPIPELDRAVLTADLPEHGLIAGDLGTVVLVHKNNAGYEIEFFALTGDTIAVVSVCAEKVRPVRRSQVAHVRDLVAA